MRKARKMYDPWFAINRPSGAKVNAKRANADHPFDFFWAMDIDGHCLFIYEYDKVLKLAGKKPRLEGISIIEFLPDGGDRKMLILSLRKAEHREIFYRLCADVLEATEECKDSASALHVMIRRAWRWNQLLRGELDGRLSSEAQKELVGELECLSNIVLSSFSPAEAMTFWESPAALPKDFVIGEKCIEVKARRGSARPFVSISSESQLDKTGLKALYLYVVNLSVAAVTDKESFNLNDYVEHVCKQIYEIDPRSIEIFETKLLEIGYQKEDDYSDRYWHRLGSDCYQVQGKFPCVVNADLPSGISGVSYFIDLGSVQDYAIGAADIKDSIKGECYE